MPHRQLARGCAPARGPPRRAKHPEFAALWEAALALSQDILAEGHDFDPGLTCLADGRLQLRPRGDFGLNADRRFEFLSLLCTFGSARAAAEVIGFSHAAFHYYKDRDPDFARAWHQALHGTAMGLEDDATGSFAALSQEEKVELFGPLFAE